MLALSPYLLSRALLPPLAIGYARIYHPSHSLLSRPPTSPPPPQASLTTYSSASVQSHDFFSLQTTREVQRGSANTVANLMVKLLGYSVEASCRSGDSWSIFRCDSSMDGLSALADVLGYGNLFLLRDHCTCYYQSVEFVRFSTLRNTCLQIALFIVSQIEESQAIFL